MRSAPETRNHTCATRLITACDLHPTGPQITLSDAIRHRAGNFACHITDVGKIGINRKPRESRKAYSDVKN